MSLFRPSLDPSPHLIDADPFRETTPIAWHQLFGNDRPVELEIGSGKGLFLLSASKNNTGHNFLGIEVARKYAVIAATRLAKHAVDNAKVWRGDARLVMGRLVPAASLRAVHVYFPDPWWKKRHKKRRVFTAEMVGHISRALERGGELRIATDVEEYFGVIQSLVAADPRFSEQPAPKLDGPGLPHECKTNFEVKYQIEGRTIYRTQYAIQ